MPTFAPWIRPFDAIGAMSAGAAAGARAGGLQLESQRLAQEASQHEQANQLAREKMSQEQLMAQMEMQAREKISQQNALRQQQQLEIAKAYKDAQIGLGMAKLQEQDAIARAKAATAAKQFSDEQGFAQFMDSGGKVAEGLQRFPGARPSFVNAIRLAQEKEPGKATVVEFPELPGQKFVRQPTGHVMRATEESGPTVTVPIDPHQPFGAKVHGKLSDPYIRSRLGTNAPAMTSTATQTPAKTQVIKFAKDPETGQYRAVATPPPPTPPPDEEDESGDE